MIWMVVLIVQHHGWNGLAACIVLVALYYAFWGCIILLFKLPVHPGLIYLTFFLLVIVVIPLLINPVAEFLSKVLPVK